MRPVLLSERVGREARRVGWARPEQGARGLETFEFPDNTMAPMFPQGTRVFVTPVKCLCGLQIGAVYVLRHASGKNDPGRWVGVGRLEDFDLGSMGTSATTTLDLCRDCDGVEHWQNVSFHRPNYYWYRVSAFISLAI